MSDIKPLDNTTFTQEDDSIFLDYVNDEKN
jgi:hypothetical protein